MSVLLTFLPETREYFQLPIFRLATGHDNYILQDKGNTIFIEQIQVENGITTLSTAKEETTIGKKHKKTA